MSLLHARAALQAAARVPIACATPTRASRCARCSAVIEGELERIEADIARLYDNWFIETCDEWVVPYIGDLLGVRPIRAIESAGVSARAYVANTIAYRRRKGTAVVLEQLARDTTGWPARAVEFFTRLATTQHMNHVRLAPTATPGVRDAAAAELADGAVRSVRAHARSAQHRDARRALQHPQHRALPVAAAAAIAVGAGEARRRSPDFMSAATSAPSGAPPGRVDSPLFNRPRTETTITQLAEEENVPGRAAAAGAERRARAAAAGRRGRRRRAS